MGFDNDCILNISSLAGEYFCAICRTLVYPNEALQAPCTHLYCKPCLAYVVSTTHACPFDGYGVTEADSKPLIESNKALAETIGNIQVHCLFYRTGCTWQGSLSDCTLHCSTCAFGESPVLCNRCGIQIKHRQVQEHAPNCSGVQSQVQQTGGTSDGTSTGAVAAPEQSQNAAQAGAPALQSQISQAPVPVVSSQDANQTANSATQLQASQAAMPTPEQWYQQQQQYQQQYQQYYQQYPGYDQYQQNYQYYYQYPQAAQQHQQPHMQAYPQSYGQAQPQVYGQAQPQPQVQVQPQPQVQVQPQSQVQVQPQAQPYQQSQVPSQGALAPLLPQTQPAVNAQPQVQPQTQGQAQAPPTHAPPYNQQQPHVQPQNAPQQQMQVPQYPQTHAQMQHPHAQAYPQSQPQQYMHPQPQMHAQPHPQQIVQAPVQVPPQQPIHSGVQQTSNAVSGYQSYPQPQTHSQAQAGVANPVPSAGAQLQAQYPSQIQGQIPSQIAQLRPPQPYSNVPNQQQPAMLPAHGQPPSGPAQQRPFYPHAQQPGYPFQQRPSLHGSHQAAPQQYAQQQSFPVQGSYMQSQPSMAPQLHAQGTSQLAQQNYAAPHVAQPNVTQNYAGRPTAPQAGGHPYVQTAGLAGTGQVRPPHQGQTYPMRTNNQVAAPGAEQVVAQSQRAENGEKAQDQMLEKGVHDQNVPSSEARNMGRASSAGSGVDESKLKYENGLDGSADESYGKSSPLASKQMPNTEANLADKGALEGKPRTNGDAVEIVSEPSGNAPNSGTDNSKDDLNKVEVKDLKHPGNYSSMDQGRNPQQPMPYASSAQLRPTGPSVPQAMALSMKPQQSAMPGHPSSHVRPQGPGQAPPRPPFHAGDNLHPLILKHPPGATPHENPAGGTLGPGPSGPYGRLGNVSHHQTGQRPGAFDSRAGMGGREPMHRPDFEQFASQMPGFDGRHPDPYPHGHMERTPYGPAEPGVQPGAMKFRGPPGQDSMLVPGMRDERANLLPEEHFKHFPRREFGDDMPNFPKPAHLEAGPSSHYGTQFPSSGPRDRGVFGGDGMPFEKGPHGFDRDPAFKTDATGGPSRFLPPFHPNDVGERTQRFPNDDLRRADFGRHPEFSGPSSGPGFGRRHIDGLPPGSPGRDYPAFPARAFGPFGDIDRNDSRVFPGDPFGKSIHENRFPVPPRGELDVPGNLRVGERLVGGPHNQDLLPSHLRRGEHMGLRSLHFGEATAFGPPGGISRRGEPPLGGNFPSHIPFGDTFGGEPGFGTGFGSQRYGHDGRFFPGEMDPFDNPRMRKPGSIMCRICKVECGSVEGLDLHSQSREHQRKARDMVLSIKQQNKKQKVSKDQASVGEGREGGRVKNSGYQGRANKR